MLTIIANTVETTEETPVTTASQPVVNETPTIEENKVEEVERIRKRILKYHFSYCQPLSYIYSITHFNIKVNSVYKIFII